ncbi:MAG: hypothetical protein RR846_10690 [Oscillospiraceae bacterium]
MAALQLNEKEIKDIFIHKVSVDARGIIKFVYSVAVVLADETQESVFVEKSKDITVKKQSPLVVAKGEKPLEKSPVICGFGPAGLFCALILARQGFKPVVLEQGEDMDSRIETVERFCKSAQLNTRSNIQFGEGGAGTFSDGKLTTRIGDERCDFVTDTLIEFGAPQEIKLVAKPHIGTDKLALVIKNIRKEIVALGGSVLFNTKLADINIKDGKIQEVVLENGTIATEVLVMATGHSARDTLFMLRDKGVNISAKPFSVGVRIESLQSEIDKGLYHCMAGHAALPKGEYQLSTKIKNRGVYTFCMCPGGTVVAAASEENALVTNGMSRHARDGKNANSALVVSVTPQDFGNDFTKAVEFQRDLERKAFALGGGGYKAPAQTVDSFISGTGKLNIKTVQPSYPIGVTEAKLATILPPFIASGIRGGIAAMNGKLKGFATDDSIMTGVETRTSSPARIDRDDSYQSNIWGVYPCGEGAGYAGGIMSAAVDGVRIAQQISSEYKTK